MCKFWNYNLWWQFYSVSFLFGIPRVCVFLLYFLHIFQINGCWVQVTLYSPWNSPGQNTGMDSLSLLQGILPTQGSNPGLPHCRQIFYQLSHKGSPKHPELLLNDRHVISPPLLWHKLDENDGEGNGTLQYSCLGNPVDRGAWRAQSMGSG